jgi:hypothetical protein
LEAVAPPSGHSTAAASTGGITLKPSAIAGLGVSGPFEHASVPKWFHPPSSHLRLLTLEEYAHALIEDGQSDAAAGDMKQRLYENGASRVAWATASGGRRGHLRKTWDVRMIDTESPGVQSLKSVIGVDGDTVPLGARELTTLRGRDGVVQAYTMPISAQKVVLPNRIIRNRVKLHYSVIAYAALAVANSAATIWAASDDPAEARSALILLTDLMLKRAQND